MSASLLSTISKKYIQRCNLGNKMANLSFQKNSFNLFRSTKTKQNKTKTQFQMSLSPLTVSKLKASLMIRANCYTKNSPSFPKYYSSLIIKAYLFLQGFFGWNSHYQFNKKTSQSVDISWPAMRFLFQNLQNYNKCHSLFVALKVTKNNYWHHRTPLIFVFPCFI